jgi:hypothetical protein
MDQIFEVSDFELKIDFTSSHTLTNTLSVMMDGWKKFAENF